MAGFLDNFSSRGIRSRLTELSRFGMKYDDLLIKNSQAIGYVESQMTSMNGLNGGVGGDELFRYSMALADTTSNMRSKSVAFFQLDYKVKREKLKDIASNGEIEFVLETITDDAIVYDEDNRFCSANDLVGEIRYKGKNKDERLKYQEKVVDKYHENFEKIYQAWGFNEGISAWQYFYQWLIEGHLAFEIIYDNPNDPREIIGFKELDPASLMPQVTQDSAGKVYLQWIQRSETGTTVRSLSDSQVIYINYANHFRTKRVSFVERLVRSFNLMRIIEHSKIIWHTMNAPLRLTTTFPIGTKSLNKAAQDAQEFLSFLKEDVYFDGDAGEVRVDGKPNILFYKNYMMPKNDRGESIEIKPLEYSGPNLSGSEMLRYFQEKLKMDSKIPYSRWDSGTGGGLFTLNAEGISREEIRYQKFIRRLRSAFKELITKPLYIQMCLDIKELKSDFRFKNALGITWYDDNIFEEMKNADLLNKRLATIGSLKALTDDANLPYFSVDFLIKEYLKMSDEDIKKNASYKAKSEKTNENPAEEGDDGGAEPPEMPQYEAGTAPATSTPPPPTGGETANTDTGQPGQM